MLSLSDNTQANSVETLNSTLWYLDDLLDIDNPYFKQMVRHIYHTELQLNKANSFDTEAHFGTRTCPKRMTLCYLKLMINEIMFILK